MNVQGNAMMEKTAEELGVSFRRNGSLILAFTDEDCKALKKLYERGLANGVPKLKLIGGEEARADREELAGDRENGLVRRDWGSDMPL